MVDESHPERFVDGGLISLVIPVFNEHESLPSLMAEIDAVSKSQNLRVEVLFVDDGSTDESWDVIRDMSTKEPRIRGVRFRGNFGKAAALQAGFQRAHGDIVLTLDADLQDDPHEIPRFLTAIESGLDVVSGWKQIRHDPWHKVFPSRVFNAMVSVVTGVKLHDHNCGFKAYRSEVVRNVRLYGELHRFVPVLAAAQGFKVGELAVHHRARKFGRSKFGWKRFIKGFLDMVSVRFTTAFGHRPLHPFGTAAFIGFGIAFLCLGLSIITWLSLVDLFPSLVLLLLSGIATILAGQALMTGLVAELLVARTARTGDPYHISDRIRIIEPLSSREDFRS